MTASLHIYTFAAVKIDGETREFGRIDRPASIAVAGQLVEKTVNVAASTTVKLFDTSLDLSSFEAVLVASDFDVMLEMVTDDNGTYGDEPATIGIRGSGVANEYGVPHILGRDDSYAGYTKNFGGGTLDVVDIIRVRNLSSTQAAKVKFWAVK